jgi:hypothetical protein
MHGGEAAKYLMQWSDDFEIRWPTKGSTSQTNNRQIGSRGRVSTKTTCNHPVVCVYLVPSSLLL